MGIIHLKNGKLEMGIWRNGVKKKKNREGWGLTGNLWEEDGEGGK